MSTGPKLVVVAAMFLFAGSASAVKPNSFCGGLLEDVADFEKSAVVNKGIARFCDKGVDSNGPNLELAAKSAEKIARKANKVCERYNARLARADCANERDPDLALAAPIPLPCVDEAGIEATLTSFGILVACNGAEDI